MATVTNLKIALQPGTENTLYASWSFKATSPSTGGGSSSSKVKVGSVVKVKAGAKWYNGVKISSFVFDDQWVVYEVKGSRAVINKNVSGTNKIMSPIHVNNLTVVRSKSTLAVEPRAESASQVDHYEVKWQYDPGNGVWFDGGSSNVTFTNHTYSYPSNATRVQVSVKPVAKSRQVNGKDTPYWTGTTAKSDVFKIDSLPPDALGAPAVTLDKYQLTAKVENIEDAKCESVEFEVYKDNVKFKTGTATVSTARASFTCAITAGGNYRVRCRAINFVGSTSLKSAWSPYSSEMTAVPNVPGNVRVSVETETSVKVSWTQDSTADSFTVEYATKKEYFDASSEVKSISVEANYAIITGIEPGHTWYFRVAAVNQQGESGWSDIVYKVLGTKPEPPTTWTLTATAIIGEPVVLYWVHNTEDGSKQNEAQIELTINGQAKVITVDTSKEEVPEDEVDKIYSYTVDLSAYPDGAEILWRVRTRGITYEYSDWSVQRSISTYAPPTASLTLGDGSGIMTAFPFNIGVTVGPARQKAISYHISIVAEYTYETEDAVGNTVLVNAGDEVFSEVFIYSDNEFSFDLMPSHVTLQNGESYNVTVTVAMDSGLTAEASMPFVVTWSDELYLPDASIVIDFETLSAYIMPFCMDVETETMIDDVVLAVYRREFDGTFTEIATEIENYGSITVTDPHPALDYARYRIVARSKTTSEIGYTDLPGIPVGEPSIVIQWDEAWSQFDYEEEAEPVVMPWTGSLIKLKGNVDVSESYNPDTSAIEYIGRKHPVGYYGTQRGASETWNATVPKDDKETIYSLRRLANWSGDVYVREPTGKGYTAQITLSMSFKHRDPVVPVTINVTRVEGVEDNG